MPREIYTISLSLSLSLSLVYLFTIISVKEKRRDTEKDKLVILFIYSFMYIHMRSHKNIQLLQHVYYITFTRPLFTNFAINDASPFIEWTVPFFFTFSQ